MSFLFDNASASLATIGIVLMVAMLGMRRTQADVGDTLRYTDARRAQALVDVMDADLQSAVALQGVAVGSGRFTFTVRADPDNPVDQTISYRMVSVSGSTLDSVVERWVDGVRVGTSAPVRTWTVQALQADGTVATVPTDAVYVRVRVQAAPASPGGALQTWESTVSPPLLRQSSF